MSSEWHALSDRNAGKPLLRDRLPSERAGLTLPTQKGQLQVDSVESMLNTIDPVGDSH
jgi:hypothetical protein